MVWHERLNLVSVKTTLALFAMIFTPHLFMPSKYPRVFRKIRRMIRLPIVDWQTEDVFEF